MASLTRRQFLQGAVVGALAAGCATESAAEVRTLDSHIHLYDPNRAGGIPWPPPSDKVLYAPHLPAQFKETVHGLNVTGAIVIEANALPADNRWCLELARREPWILGYMARLTPGEPNFAAELASYCRSPVFKGLRLRDDMFGALNTADFQHDLARLTALSLTLDMVGNSSILEWVPRVAEAAPNARIVIDHLPFDDLDNDPGPMRRAAKHPNVYAKVSNVLRRRNGQPTTDVAFYQKRLDTIWEIFGEDRVLFGSNWPVSDYSAPYVTIHQFMLSYVQTRGESAVRKYFRDNCIAAYDLKPRHGMAPL